MKKKGILIAIIVLIIVLVLMGGAFAYIYFATDMLKSDKELFAKYALQMGDKENGFAPAILAEYENKKNTIAYENNGNISVITNILGDTTTDTEAQSLATLIDIANNTSVDFSGKVDKTNKKAQQNITVNYSDTVNDSINFRQDGDIYGLQSDIISQSYVAVENNNLQEFAQKFGVTDISNIPNKIEINEFPKLNFTDEEITHIKEQYVLPAFDRFADEKFTKANNSDGSTTYILSATNIELRDTLVQILETFKNDTMLLNKFNSYLQELVQVYGTNESEQLEIKVEDIDEMITNLNEENIKETMVQISITQKSGITNKVSITTADIVFNIEKQQTESNLSYNVTIKGNEETSATNETGVEADSLVGPEVSEQPEISLNLNFSGLNTNSTTESASIDIVNPGDNYETTYSYTNTLTFGNAITFETFGEDTAILNNYNGEQITPFIMQISQIIAQNNTNKMNQIGFPAEYVNPIMMWAAFPSYFQIYNSVNNSIQNSNLNVQEKDAYNMQFENYKGQISGSEVKSLCDKIRINDLDGMSKEINVKLGEPASATSFVDKVNDIDTIKSSILSGRTYDVTLSYDTSTGYVCEIGIVEIN